MDRSAYLAQALQAMSQPAQAPNAGMGFAQMQQIAQKKKAWEAQNPGQSYFDHAIGQMGQNIGNIPGNLMQAGSNIAALPGAFVGGLQKLGASVMGPQPTQYGGVPTNSGLP